MGYQQAPLSNLYESVVFFAWSILLIYLLFDLKYKYRAIGAFVMPFAFAGHDLGAVGLDATIAPLVPALQSNWLTYHVITCFLGYAAFAVACGVSIMYLIKVGKEESGCQQPGERHPRHVPDRPRCSTTSTTRRSWSASRC